MSRRPRPGARCRGRSRPAAARPRGPRRRIPPPRSCAPSASTATKSAVGELEPEPLGQRVAAAQRRVHEHRVAADLGAVAAHHGLKRAVLDARARHVVGIDDRHVVGPRRPAAWPAGRRPRSWRRRRRAGRAPPSRGRTGSGTRRHPTAPRTPVRRAPRTTCRSPARARVSGLRRRRRARRRTRRSRRARRQPRRRAGRRRRRRRPAREPARRSSAGGVPSWPSSPPMCAAARLLCPPRSSTSVRRRARPSTMAALSPATPPPTTTQSKS